MTESTQGNGDGKGGVQLLHESKDQLTKLAPVLRQGGIGTADDSEYEEALKCVVETIVKTAGWVSLPSTFESVEEGIRKTEADQHIRERIRWSTFKHATGGWDWHFFRKSPTPLMLLQQVAYSAAAVADHGKNSSAPRLEVQVDLLEEAFQCVADKKMIPQYKSMESDFGIPLKGLQFSIMRLLCLLYRQLLFADRIKNLHYLFRHAEAAGIMIMLANEQYAGHVEHAWNTIEKLTSGVMHITQSVLEHGFQSARHAASTSAHMGHDFAFVPAAYDLVFLITVGFPGSTFELSKVKKVMQEIQAGEQRLANSNLKDAVLFHCPSQQYMSALTKEWEREDKARKAVDKKKGKKNKSKKDYLEEERLQDVQPGHLPVTDWRVFDQRFLSYYTWLEPPLQPEPQKCENCGIQCLKVHRCDTCKFKAYCSSMCAAAHMFEHECHAAPKPWLSPPVGPKQPPPAELGEEGLFGFIPWSLVRYAFLATISYVAYRLLEAFLNFQEDNRVGVLEAISMLFNMLWEAISSRVELVLGTGKATEPTISGSISTGMDTDPDVADAAAQGICESLPDDIAADTAHMEL
eukprot:jgi/Ulvmu1/7776/UM004_0005.1